MGEALPQTVATLILVLISIATGAMLWMWISYTGLSLNAGGSTTISVSLTWVQGKTVADFSYGTIIIEPAT